MGGAYGDKDNEKASIFALLWKTYDQKPKRKEQVTGFCWGTYTDGDEKEGASCRS